MAATSKARLYLGDVQISGTSAGAPGAPLNLVRNANVITFDAGKPGSEGPTLSYVANIKPHGPKAIFDNSIDLTVGGKLTLDNIQKGVEYTVELFAVNAAGSGEKAGLGPFQVLYNVASGGTVTDVDNYNGTGKKWRVHTFTKDDKLNVSCCVEPFSVLAVAGGGNGAGGYNAGNNGGSGGKVVESDYSMAVKTYDVYVGSAAKPSSISGVVSASGYGASGGKGSGCSNHGCSGSDGTESTITGSSVYYGGGGGGGGGRGGTDRHAGCGGAGGKGGGGKGGGGLDDPIGVGTTCNSPSYAGSANTGGGGGGGGGHRPGSGAYSQKPGGSGVVIVAYQIG